MKVGVCDKHVMFNEAVSAMLECRGHDVVARITAPDQVSELTDPQEPDVWLTEIEFAHWPRAAAVDCLRAAAPNRPVVVLTSRNDAEVLSDVASSGADALVLKTEGIEEVDRLVRRVGDPPPHVPSGTPGSLECSLQARSLHRRGGGTGAHALTAKEREVMARLARGESTAAVARGLGVGVSTVRTHLQHVYEKIDVHSKLEMVAFAVRHGLVRMEGDRTDTPA